MPNSINCFKKIGICPVDATDFFIMPTEIEYKETTYPEKSKILSAVDYQAGPSKISDAPKQNLNHDFCIKKQNV